MGKAFTTVYDAAQRKFTATTPLNRSTAVTTDAQGRPLTAQITGILPVSYAYDTRGVASQPLARAAARLCKA